MNCMIKTVMYLVGVQLHLPSVQKLINSEIANTFHGLLNTTQSRNSSYIGSNKKYYLDIAPRTHILSNSDVHLEGACLVHVNKNELKYMLTFMCSPWLRSIGSVAALQFKSLVYSESVSET